MLPPTNSYTPVKKNHGLRSLLFLCVVLLVSGYAALHRQQLYDSWQLRGYTAPVAIADLATQDAMTSYARRIYYVNHPVVITGNDFSQACPNNGGEKTIVLGCYHGGQRGIVLLSVSDPLLNGVEQVTAAHEMLHSAYDRLSSGERSKVNSMLENYYQHDLHDERILAIMAAYKQSEPKDVANEMHSVFGTEIANLPQPLEQYYQRYFTDRTKVTKLANKYQSEFTGRQNTIAADSAQLSTMKNQITALEDELKSRLSGINAEQSRLASLRDSDIPTYNSGVPGYNRMVDDYNYQVNNLQRLVDKYNQLVVKMNTVVLEEDQLVKELSASSPAINK